MPAKKPVRQLNFCALRISRLLTDGTPAYGEENGALVFCGGLLQLQESVTTETIAAIFETDGCRVPWLNIPAKDVVTGIDPTITIGFNTPLLNEILGIGGLVLDGADVVGATTNLLVGCEVGEDSFVAIEGWSERFDCTDPAEPRYVRTVLPMVAAAPQDFTREAGMTQFSVGGKGRSNPNFGAGPFLDLAELETHSNWGEANLVDADLPECVPYDNLYDYVPLPAAPS